jgi:putative Holliday junction resolvase
MSSLAGRAATLLAFDYGEKRIGVAVGNSLTRSARPLVVVQNRNREYRFEAVGKLIAETLRQPAQRPLQSAGDVG